MNKYKDDDSLSYGDLAELGFVNGPFMYLIEYFGLIGFLLIAGIFLFFYTFSFKVYLIYYFPSFTEKSYLVLSILISIIPTIITLWLFGTIVFHKIKCRISWAGMSLRFIFGVSALVIFIWLLIINIIYALIGGLLIVFIHYSLLGYYGSKVIEEVSCRDSIVNFQEQRQVKHSPPEEALLRETFIGGDYKRKVTDYVIDDIEINMKLVDVELKRGCQEASYVELQYQLKMLIHKTNNLRYDKLLMTQNKLNELKNATLEADRLESMIQCEKLINERNKAYLLTEIAHYRALITELLSFARNMKMKNNSDYSDFDF